MIGDAPPASPLWPLGIKLQLLGDEGAEGLIELRPGITTLVGANGSGKTRALRAIKTALAGTNRIASLNRKIHLLAAGRSSPFEGFRAFVDSPGSMHRGDAAVGHISYRDSWHDLESVTGALLALDGRADLRLKIEARLQQLLDRSVSLGWSQSGLTVRITPVTGGGSYPANVEASGILQLVALLSAIHNNEIGALLIDEPEISLHPQHQAFLLEEMERAAGDPTDLDKKLIVIATHSPLLLPLRRIGELPNLAFFSSPRQPPAQVPANGDILKRQKLAALIARMSSTHRIAMFADRVLLVEGPSDEIISSQLARSLDLRLLARNAQILPVTGKGEFGEAAKLFRLMHKQVAVLADLDALADDNGLVRSFSELPAAGPVAERFGRNSLADLDHDLRNELAKFMLDHAAAVDAAAASYPDCSSADSVSFAKRRVTLARILTDPGGFGSPAATTAKSLQTKFDALLTGLAELGCFFLRKGTVENYYRLSTGERSKPDLAAEEAAGFEEATASELQRDFADIVSALLHIAPNQRVDEDMLLRPKLGAVLSAAFLGMNAAMPDETLNALAKNTIGTDAEVFKLTNVSDIGLRINVDIASPLFKRDAFPFDIGREDNPNIVVPRHLPGNKTDG